MDLGSLSQRGNNCLWTIKFSRNRRLVTSISFRVFVTLEGQHVQAERQRPELVVIHIPIHVPKPSDSHFNRDRTMRSLGLSKPEIYSALV